MNYSFALQPELPRVDQENEGGSVFGLVVSSPTKASPARLLPADFNPRLALGMPFEEKINSWLRNVPWVRLAEDVWVLDCYPGHASSGLEDVKSTPDNQDIVEQQARQITRIVTHNYLHNGEKAIRVSDPESESEDYLFGYAESEYL